MHPEILEETPITMSDLKDEINKIKKRDEELNFRVTKTEEYLNEFSKLSKTKREELVNKLNKLKVPRLKDIHIGKIVDTLPIVENDMAVLMQAYTITISKENIKKILETVKSVIKK